MNNKDLGSTELETLQARRDKIRLAIHQYTNLLLNTSIKSSKHQKIRDTIETLEIDLLIYNDEINELKEQIKKENEKTSLDYLYYSPINFTASSSSGWLKFTS